MCEYIWAATCDFQQCGILTSVDSDEPVQTPFKLRNLKWGSVCSLTVIEYLSDQQRLWSVWAYEQAGLSLCWSHNPHCWKSHVAVHFIMCRLPTLKPGEQCQLETCKQSLLESAYNFGTKLFLLVLLKVLWTFKKTFFKLLLIEKPVMRETECWKSHKKSK